MNSSSISHWYPAMPPAQSPPLPISNKSNSELACKFGEWLVAQRFSRSAYEAYTKVAFSFCHFIGRRHVSTTNHLDVRFFLIDLMKRDLTVDGYNRHLYALRRFFDFSDNPGASQRWNLCALHDQPQHQRKLAQASDEH